MSFESLPVELMLSIVEALPLEPWYYSEQTNLPDYSTRMATTALTTVNRYIHRVLTPAVWATDKLEVRHSKAPSFILAAASSRFFHADLGHRVSHVSLCGFTAQNNSHRDTLAVSRGVYRTIAPCSHDEPLDMTSDSAPQDLLWMALVACRSPKVLKIHMVNFVAMSPTLRSKLPLPSTWGDRLSDLDVSFYVNSDTDAESAFSLFGECPRLSALRRLKITFLVQAVGTATRISGSGPAKADLSSVEELSVYCGGTLDEVIAGVIFHLVQATRPRQLNMGVSTSPAFYDRLAAELPDSVRDIVLADNTTQIDCATCEATSTEALWERPPRRMFVETESHPSFMAIVSIFCFEQLHIVLKRTSSPYQFPYSDSMRMPTFKAGLRSLWSVLDTVGPPLPFRSLHIAPPPDRYEYPEGPAVNIAIEPSFLKGSRVKHYRTGSQLEEERLFFEISNAAARREIDVFLAQSIITYLDEVSF